MCTHVYICLCVRMCVYVAGLVVLMCYFTAGVSCLVLFETESHTETQVVLELTKEPKLALSFGQFTCSRLPSTQNTSMSHHDLQVCIF